MPRRKSRKKSRRKSRRSGGYQHIYFEAKIPKSRDSVYAAVYDIGKPGVNSAKEVKLIAAAQLADLADGKTVDHSGRVKKFSGRTWVGRLRILYLLAKRYGGKSAVKIVAKYGSKALKVKSPKERRKIVVEGLKRLGLSPPTIRRLLRKTNK